MAGAFRIAEGYVEVTADESAYDTAMDRLKAKKHKVSITADLDTRAAADDLAVLTRDRIAKITARVDTTGAATQLHFSDRIVNLLPELEEAALRLAEEQLGILTRDRTVRIIADLDTRAAADDLALLTRARTTRITADADTNGARADLDVLARDRRVNVQVDLDRSALSRLTSLFSGGGGGGSDGMLGKLRELTATVLRWSAIAGSALPTIVSLGQSIAAMGPAAAVAAPAVLSLGAAFAAVKLGTSGISDAFKQAFAPATASANTAATATHRVEDAQRSLAKAQQGVKDAEVRAVEARVQAARQIQDAQLNLKNTVSDVADANRRAAEQVAQAERDLADAQRAAKQAQLDLTAARKQAAEDLQDLNNRLADAQLDQRQKVLDVQDAEQNLNAVKAKGAAASAEDLAKAQLQYDQAVQALQEQQTETQRLQQQTTDANAAGVEGSKTVTDAKQHVADANQEIKDKTQALKDAEIEQARTAQDGAQKVAKAERDLADARAAAAKAAVDGARQIADAQQAAADAARSLAEAQTSGAAATSKTANALAKLAPNARAFVNAVIAQAPAWRALKLDVQNRLFAGLGDSFTTMSRAILPDLRTGLTGTAGVLNRMGKGVASTIAGLGKSGTIKKLFAGINAGLSPLSRVPGQMVKGFAQIGVAAAPAFKRITTATGGVFDRISKQVDTAAKNGHLEKIIDQAFNIAKQIGHVIGDIFGTVGNIMKAAGKAGGDALGSIGSIFKELRKITAMPEVQKALTSIFKALSDVGKLLAGALGQAIQAMLPLLAQLAPFVSQLAKQLGPVVGQLLNGLGKALTPIISALLPVLSDVGGLLVGLVRAVMPLLKPIGDLLGAVIKAIAPVISNLGAALVPLVAALAKGLAPVVQALVPAVQLVGQFLAALTPMFPTLLQALTPLIPPIAQLTVSLLNLAMQVITPLMPLITGLAELLATVLAGAVGVLVPVITTVIGWLTALADGTTKVIGWIVDGFKWLYDVLVGHSIIPDLVKAIISWFTQLWAKTKEIFSALKKWTVNTWNSLWNSVRSKWDSFWGGLKNAVSGSWRWFRDSVSSLKSSISGTWSSLWNGARDKMSSIFGTIRSKVGDFKNALKSAFSALRDSLGSIWNGIKSKISSPVRWVVDHVYNSGIRRMWNTIAGKISSHLSLPTISLGFNRGGVVPGSGNSDTVPAMLTPGERILSKQQVAQLGGHRGIDAMLGQDKPTRTGGNPSQQEERRREQVGGQHFASGGIVGKVTSAIGGGLGSAFDWAKDLVLGGLKAAAQKALSSLVRPLINAIPGSGIGNLMRGLVNKGVDGMLGWFGNEDKKAKGGPAVQRALAWAKSQGGKPYQWAGNGNPSWDCSGFMSAIESVIRGEKPHRRWATGAFVGNSGPSGWVRNLKSPFEIGITNAGVGHTAGTLAGVNVESSGGLGVHYGKTARGAGDGLFTSRWGFAPAAKYDSGGLLAEGATMVVNATRKPERVLTPQQNATFERLVQQGGGSAGAVTIEHFEVNVNGNMDLTNSQAMKRLANAMPGYMNEALRKWNKERAR